MLVFIVLFASFVLVKDLGPLLILSILFLTLFYVVTRSTGWVVTALVVVALLVTVAIHVPAVSGSPKVALRMKMWLDPWTNAQPNGDQIALSRWGSRSIARSSKTRSGWWRRPKTATRAVAGDV